MVSASFLFDVRAFLDLRLANGILLLIISETLATGSFRSALSLYISYMALLVSMLI